MFVNEVEKLLVDVEADRAREKKYITDVELVAKLTPETKQFFSTIQSENDIDELFKLARKVLKESKNIEINVAREKETKARTFKVTALFH